MAEEEDSFAAQVERRWGFLSPWWEALKPCIKYYNQYSPDEYVWQLPEILVKVAMPRRNSSNGEDEAAFRRRFQEVREALALLVAVEHADYDAYNRILTEKCGVYHGRYGEEISEVNIAVKFILDVDEDGHEINADAADSVEYDLVNLCGTDQREHPSEEYLTALSQIAALDENLKSGEAGVDIQIPVRVDFREKLLGDAIHVDTQRNYAKALRDIANAEKEIDAQWEAYRGNTGEKGVEAGALRCTFVLEPMSVNAGLMPESLGFVDALGQLVVENVWFSSMDAPVPILIENSREAIKIFGQFFRRALNGTRRNQEDAHIGYYFDTGATHRGLIDGGGSSQLAELRLACEATMSSRDIEAMCSAMTLIQSTEKLSLFWS